MDIYNLGKVDSTIEGVIGPLRYGFNVIGVHGRPLVTLAFRTRPPPVGGFRGNRQQEQTTVAGAIFMRTMILVASLLLLLAATSERCRTTTVRVTWSLHGTGPT
jgi:hypothetical protein